LDLDLDLRIIAAEAREQASKEIATGKFVVEEELEVGPRRLDE
jgi:hypothetical protein